ncbi:small GTPase RHO1 [Blastomyces dermatitidis ATCC 18188]|uniref:Small GTPase RHO1 n=1 Tax=Ajellomyces dermatitidis (strain ATCC 18188 / CBS 674.68) TaxID=653446 RepID=F2TB43_AJEDA|nr:small GTPase RHO1 [Blastomyces dermatitidis ATCC 18188]
MNVANSTQTPRPKLRRIFKTLPMKKHVSATSHSPAIICFSVTNIHSFHAIESSWLEEANHFHPRGIPKIFIGNKVDLRTHHAGEGHVEKGGNTLVNLFIGIMNDLEQARHCNLGFTPESIDHFIGAGPNLLRLPARLPHVSSPALFLNHSLLKDSDSTYPLFENLKLVEA